MASDLAPPFPYSVVDSLYYGEPLFTEADTLALFLVVGPPDEAKEKAEAVAFKLSELGKSFAFDLWHEGQPNLTEQAAVTRKLEMALTSALNVAGFGEEEPTREALHPFLGSGGLFGAAALRIESSDVQGTNPGQAAVMNAFRAIHILRQDARKLMEIEARRRVMKPASKGNTPQRAMKRLVAGLAGVYFDVWQTLPGFSRGASKTPSGPFIRLMLEVTEALRNRGLVFSATAESLARHWRELPSDERLKFDVAEMGSLTE